MNPQWLRFDKRAVQAAKKSCSLLARKPKDVYKRQGVEQPKEVSLGIQQANDEIAHLDLEIMATQAKMKE